MNNDTKDLEKKKNKTSKSTRGNSLQTKRNFIYSLLTLPTKRLSDASFLKSKTEVEKICQHRITKLQPIYNIYEGRISNANPASYLTYENLNPIISATLFNELPCMLIELFDDEFYEKCSTRFLTVLKRKIVPNSSPAFLERIQFIMEERLSDPKNNSVTIDLLNSILNKIKFLKSYQIQPEGGLEIVIYNNERYIEFDSLIKHFRFKSESYKLRSFLKENLAGVYLQPKNKMYVSYQSTVNFLNTHFVKKDELVNPHLSEIPIFYKPAEISIFLHLNMSAPIRREIGVFKIVASNDKDEILKSSGSAIYRLQDVLTFLKYRNTSYNEEHREKIISDFMYRVNNYKINNK